MAGLNRFNDAVFGIEASKERCADQRQGTSNDVIQVMGMYLRTPPIQRMS
jgi:hypothetical protein